MKIATVRATAVEYPLDEPFEIALGTQTAAENVLVEVETMNGVIGYGEGSPIPPVTGETQSSAVAVAKRTTELLAGESLSDYRRRISELRRAFPTAVSSLLALETALLDAYCRSHSIPLSALFGGEPRPVETDITIPIVDAEAARERATAAVSDGFEHLKVKTGSDVDDDVERARAVREAAPEAELKVDANQGWTPAETVRFVDECADHGVDLALVEQPVRSDDIDGLARVREAVRVPIAADESVFTPADAIRVVRADAADIVNVKLGKSGLLGALDIVAIARAANLELMVGCMLESAIGIHAAAHLVAGTDAFSYVDLDGNQLLARDVVDDRSGPIIHPRGPGIGLVPDIVT